MLAGMETKPGSAPRCSTASWDSRLAPMFVGVRGAARLTLSAVAGIEGNVEKLSGIHT